MKSAKIIRINDQSRIQTAQLDDFSRFKEKLIMINALKTLRSKINDTYAKEILEQYDSIKTYKKLRRIIHEIIDAEIRRVER